MKYEQCEEFWQALQDSKDMDLVHNMENDETWGFGRYGKGNNLMGVILMELRDSSINVPHQSVNTPPGASVSDNTSRSAEQAATNSQKKEAVMKPAPVILGVKSGTKQKEIPQKTPVNEFSDTVVYGDSMVKELHKHIDGSWEIHSFSGQGVDVIHRQILADLDKLRSDKVKKIIIHAGTNDVEKKSVNEIHSTMRQLVDDLQWHLPRTSIIVSGIVHRMDKSALNKKIDKINNELKGLVNDQVAFVDHNPTMGNISRYVNSRGLHLKANGMKVLAENLTLGTTLVPPRTGGSRPSSPGAWKPGRQGQRRGLHNSPNQGRKATKYQERSRGGSPVSETGSSPQIVHQQPAVSPHTPSRQHGQQPVVTPHMSSQPPLMYPHAPWNSMPPPKGSMTPHTGVINHHNQGEQNSSQGVWQVQNNYPDYVTPNIERSTQQNGRVMSHCMPHIDRYMDKCYDAHSVHNYGLWRPQADGYSQPHNDLNMHATFHQNGYYADRQINPIVLSHFPSTPFSTHHPVPSANWH